MWIQTLNLKRTNTKSEESEEQIPVTFFLWSIGNRNSRCYVEVVSNKGKIIHLDKALDSGTKWQQVGNSFPHLDVRDSGKTVELKSACRKW